MHQRPAVVPITSKSFTAAHAALVEAFLDYPLMVYAARDLKRRRRGVRVLYGAILYDCLRHGEVFATPQMRGVACWLPPGKPMPGFLRQLRSGMLRLPWALGLGSLRMLVDYDEAGRALHDEHARAPHWYLAALGVRPEFQGTGLGGALLECITTRADQQGVACYLETHREQNVRLYERHGFQVACRRELAEHPVPVWAMSRPPAA